MTPTDVREHGIRCACGIEVDSGLMVHCKFCNHWQHGVSVTKICTLLKKIKMVRVQVCRSEILYRVDHLSGKYWKHPNNGIIIIKVFMTTYALLYFLVS